MKSKKTKNKKLRFASNTIKNINKNKNIINIKINPIQQTNRRRRRRKQLNKSLNKKPVDNVQGYYANPNTNMKPSSYYNPNNSFQRTKDLLLQDERTKYLLEDKKLKFDSGKDNVLGIDNIEYPRLEFKDPLRTKNRLLEKKDTAQTKPLIQEVENKKRLKNEPEFKEDDNNIPNVHTDEVPNEEKQQTEERKKNQEAFKKYQYEAYKQAVEEQNPNFFSKSSLNSNGGTTAQVLYYMYDKAIDDELLTPSSQPLDREEKRRRLSSLLPVKPRKNKNKNKNKNKK